MSADLQCVDNLEKENIILRAKLDWVLAQLLDSKQTDIANQLVVWNPEEHASFMEKAAR